MKTESEKFKAQYSEKHWSKLMANERFKSKWDAGDIVSAGEIASIVIEGDELNLKEARLKTKIDRISEIY